MVGADDDGTHSGVDGRVILIGHYIVVITTAGSGTATQPHVIVDEDVHVRAHSHALERELNRASPDEFVRALRRAIRRSDLFSTRAIEVIRRTRLQRPQSVIPDPPWPRARDPPTTTASRPTRRLFRVLGHRVVG